MKSTKTKQVMIRLLVTLDWDFYSAFMVADKVTIDTLSYKEGAKAVKWSSDGGTEYEMGESDRTERGTSITLYLNDESHEFANAYRVREYLKSIVPLCLWRSF